LLLVASLAYSLDWLGHEVLKFRGNTGVGTGRKSRGTKGMKSSGNNQDSDAWAGNVVGELFQVRRVIIRSIKIAPNPSQPGTFHVVPSSQLSETCLLWIRMEIVYACFYYMQQLPFGSRYDTVPVSTPATTSSTQASSSQGATGASKPATNFLSTGPSVESCVASLNRCVNIDALSGILSLQFD